MNDDPKPIPPIRRRQLAYRLAELRATAGLTQDEVVVQTGISRSTISKIENAEQAILEKNVRLLAGTYGVASPDLDMLLRMARESNHRGLLVAHAEVAPDFARDYIKLESYATEVWTFETVLVPGLLQAPAYVADLRRTWKPEASDAEVGQAVSLRAERQRRLTGDSPLKLRAILDEKSLSGLSGATDLFRQQVDRLLAMSELPHVTLQVVPESAGIYRGMGYPFSVLKFDPTPGMDVAYAEGWLSAAYYERQDEVAAHVALFDHVSAVALSVEATREYLATLVDALGSTPD